MKRTKQAISLITLVITIIIMIILAGVILISLSNTDIFDKAKEAVDKYNDKQQQIIDDLTWAENYPDGKKPGNVPGEDEILTVVDMKNRCVDKNIKVVDEFGNQIVIPAGFKIRVDDDEGIKGDEKTIATNVTQGIVIEDCTEASTNGSQFVWVPVGKIYTDVYRTEEEVKTIKLGRYGDQDNDVNNFVLDKNGVYTPTQEAKDYATPVSIKTQYWPTFIEDIRSSFSNTTAKDIGEFVTSATQNYGYYIGRYEAGDSTSTSLEEGKDLDGDDFYEWLETRSLVCETNQIPFNLVTQSSAAACCREMYNDGYTTGTFTSDLINSYAWDTAIVFIQIFGGKEADDYYIQNNGTSLTVTGGNRDEYCNINDMSGNTYEWSTESTHDDALPDVVRGGYTSSRSAVTGGSTGDISTSFRPILYVAKPQ